MENPADQTADCEGLLCPLPVLRARKILLSMGVGQVLEIRTTDPMARIDLPHFCGQAGHEYLGLAEVGGVLIHRIRRGFHA
ncbi:sulfurtransferase TusA family protein [Neogemmobacter tilapiae]|nr:sulfurtransferase TusA family protein [Gemmobacter tilapiae]